MLLQTNNLLLDIKKAFSEKIEPLDMVLPGLLSGSVGSLVAPGSTGKGYLANSLCASLTTVDLLGLGIHPTDCQVAYITAEDPLSILEHRVCALGALLSPDQRKTFSERVQILSLAGCQPSLLDGKKGRNENWIEWLKEICTGKRLVIIDTLRRFHQARENDSGAMTYLIQLLEEVAKATGCALVFTHHTKKNAALNGLGTETDASRGSTALSFNIRWQVNMQIMTENEADHFGVDQQHRHKYVQIIGPKTNYDEFGLQGWLMRTDGGVLIKADLAQSPLNIMRLYGGK